MPRKSSTRSLILPLLPRRRGVLFPNVASAILVGRHTSVRAVDEATQRGYDIAVATQRDPAMTAVGIDDLFPIATEAVINRALRLPDGTTQVWAAGQRRLQIEEIVGDGAVLPGPGDADPGERVAARCYRGADACRAGAVRESDAPLAHDPGRRLRDGAQHRQAGLAGRLRRLIA